MHKTKPIIAVFLVAILVSSGILSGCGPKTNKSGGDAANNGPKVEHPFTFDCDPTGKDLASFAENDTAGTLLAANPFYAGAQPIPGGKASEYDKARAAKVDEIIDEADKLIKNSALIELTLEKTRKAYLKYLTTAFKSEPKLEDFTKTSFTQISLLKSKEQVARSTYESVPKKGVSNKLTRSMLDYLKVVKAIEVGELYLEDVETIGKHAALVLEAMDKNSDPTIKSANKALDSNMKDLDKIMKPLSNIIVSMQKIDYGFKQLKTGDYYMSREALAFMKKEMPSVKKKADSLVPGKQLTKDDIEFIQNYVSFVDKTQKVLEKQLANIDKNELIDIGEKQNKNSGLLETPIAFADTNKSDYIDAFRSITQPTESIEPKKGFFELGWSKIKSAVHGAQTAAGVTIDTLGAIAGSASSVGIGLYRGSNWEEIGEDVAQAWDETADNFRRGLSGSSTLRTADKYFEDFESGAGTLAGSAAEATVGEGWTSWAIAGTTKITAGMFTGIGKGIVKLADRNADAPQITQGLLELTFAFIGGSKSFIKLSQMPGALRGLGKEGMHVGRTGLNFLEQAFNGLDRQFISMEIRSLLSKNKLTIRELASLINNQLESISRQTIINALQQTRQQLVQRMTTIIEQVGKAYGALEAEIDKSLYNLLERRFADNLSGVIEALETVVGGNIKEYLDNLTGSWLDNHIKDLIKDILKDAPNISEINGNWKGSLTITEVLVDDPEELQGCDIEIDPKELAGKTEVLTLVFAINGSDEASGSGKVIVITKGSNQSVPATYTNGNISFSFNQNGASAIFASAVTQTDSGLSMGGATTINFKGKPFAKAKWSVTKS